MSSAAQASVNKAAHLGPTVINAFSWPRFMALLRVDMAERWRSYAAFMAGVAVVHVLVLILIFANAGASPMRYSSQMGFYYGFLLAFGAAFACLLYAPLQRQGSVLLALVLPASSLEKWLHAAWVLLVFFPLAYTLTFLFTYVPANALAAAAESAQVARRVAMGETVIGVGFSLFLPLLPLAPKGQVALDAQMFFIWCYWILMGFAAFSLVLFRRAAAIKTLGLALVVALLSIMVMSMSPRHGNFDSLALWLNARGRADMGALEVTASVLFWLVVPVSLWWASFRAWRERDLA